MGRGRKKQDTLTRGGGAPLFVVRGALYANEKCTRGERGPLARGKKPEKQQLREKKNGTGGEMMNCRKILRDQGGRLLLPQGLVGGGCFLGLKVQQASFSPKAGPRCIVLGERDLMGGRGEKGELLPISGEKLLCLGKRACDEKGGLKKSRLCRKKLRLLAEGGGVRRMGNQIEKGTFRKQRRPSLTGKGGELLLQERKRVKRSKEGRKRRFHSRGGGGNASKKRTTMKKKMKQGGGASGGWECHSQHELSPKRRIRSEMI